MPTVNEELLDAAISHQIGIQGFSTRLVRKIIALLNRVDPDIRDQITKLEEGTTRARLEKILDAIRVILRDAYSEVGKELRDELKALAVYEVGYQADLFDHVLPIEFDVIKPDANLLRAVVDSRPFQGRHLRDWVKDIEGSAFARLRDSIRIGMVEGETIDQMVRRVRGTRVNNYRDGILEVNRRSAEALVRTAVTHTAARAREYLYEANTDLIKGVRWVSTLDSRTSPVCQDRDGRVYEPGKGPRPPAHPNCRSTTVPVTKSWKEMGINLPQSKPGTRASMDGQIPADTTFGQWLAKKPASFQDDVLGVTKGKLFRNGGLTLDRFVDRAGREYTLDELRKRESAAFEKAGLAA